MSSTAQAVPHSDPSLSWDDPTAYLDLLATLTLEYQPATPLETVLVERMARHFSLAQRALALQELCFHAHPADPPSPNLALYLRYQAHHDRAFFKYSAELRAHRNENRKAEREFVSQKRLAEQESARGPAETRRAAQAQRHEAQEQRAQAAELRKIEIHQARLRALNAKTLAVELDTDIRQTVEAPLPGHMRIPFDAMRDTFKHVVGEISRQLASESAPAA